MSACRIVITGAQPGCGKTHFGAALGRWLARRGLRVEVLHLGARSVYRVVASDGAVISRPAAILAEAALVEPGARHEDASRLEELSQSADVVLIESCGAVAANPAVELKLEAGEGFFILDGYGKLPEWEGPPISPATPDDVAAMEPWRIGGWPRVGVITLPNLSNFSDLRILRGAEWIVVPPPGRLAVIFLPATADAAADQEWLEAQGLTGWLEQQCEQGCRLVSIGWKYRTAEAIETGELLDHVIASRLIGRRLDPPMPSEETLERLGDWIGSWPQWKSLVERLEARVVK